jgi:hypothetical protein
MRSTRPAYSTILSLLLIFFTSSIVVRAQDDETDEYDVKARVVRISLLSGEVKLKRQSNTDWERARLNYPLVEGDTISTERESRIEIQIDARNFVRLGSNSTLRIVTLRDDGVAISVVEGTASLRLAKLDHQKEYFEIDAPGTTLAAEKTGLYRIDVGKNSRVRLTARNGGRARIYSDKSGFALRDGRTAELIVDGTDAGEWEILTASDRDPWDLWIDDRERYLAERLSYDNKYYDEFVWGAEELDAYGEWINSSDYGWIWRPHATAINIYDNWAPYRYGQWTWVLPYGWTWVGNEPWGWAPYHYGRWVYYNNHWVWIPRSQYHRRRSWWRPALVAFVFNINFGDQICWYPLSYHDRDPRSRNYHRRHDRRRGDSDRRRGHHGDWRGVTGVARREFGGRHSRPRAGDERWGRRVVDAEPLPDVPVRPASEVNRPATDGETDGRTARWTVARRERVPAADVPAIPTGAAERDPGVPLDRELRRTRVWNGRNPRTDIPAPSGGATGEVETRPTGAVDRPARGNPETGPTNDGAPRTNRRPIREAPPSLPSQSGNTPDTVPQTAPT